jgi:hypothetical protein
MAAGSFIKLPLLAQTTYARLLDLLLTSEAGDLAAGTTLVSKNIRGRRYWYAQRHEAGKKLQSYIGPETPELATMIERWRRSRVEAADRSELVAMARAGGAHVIGAAEAAVLQRLAPVFRVGGVLVGSHAFAVLGNMLGVRWQDAIVRTDDVDIAHDFRIAVALARDGQPADIKDALGDPMPRFSVLNPTDPATSFRVRGTDVEVELLTPMIGKESNRPIRIEPLGVAATPLRFLDYLIEETQPGAVVGGSGVLVNVPRPGRFALHKLIVASRRGLARSPGLAKAPKDREQASALLRVLIAEVPGEITLAWKALRRRGKAWTAAANSSLARLDPALVSDLRALGLGNRG